MPPASTQSTQSTLLTMGLDAASAHPDLIVNTKNNWNTMKRRFDTVAARRAFGRSDVLAHAHLSKAMGRLAEKGIYLPMSKDMLQGEIAATKEISGLEEQDAAVGRLSLTPMGEFSYQRKEIAEGEDWEANKPSYNYNQGVLTKLKKRIHRIGKKHPAAAKGDLKGILQEKEALEDEYSKIIDEMVKSNYYLNNADGDDDDDSKGDGSSSSSGNDPFHPPGGSFHGILPVRLGGNVGIGGLSTPPRGFGGNGSSSGGGGPGGSVTMDLGNPATNTIMEVNPGFDDARSLANESFGLPGSLHGSALYDDDVMSTSSFGSIHSTGDGGSVYSARSAGSQRSSHSTMSRMASMHFAGQPQQVGNTGVNLSGKDLGQPVNMNNATATTINATNNSSANETFRSTRTLGLTPSLESSFAKEASANTMRTVANQEFAPMNNLGRGLLRDNTEQRQTITNTPDAIPTGGGFNDDDFRFNKNLELVPTILKGFTLDVSAIDTDNDFMRGVNSGKYGDDEIGMDSRVMAYIDVYNQPASRPHKLIPDWKTSPNSVHNLIKEGVTSALNNDEQLVPRLNALMKTKRVSTSDVNKFVENLTDIMKGMVTAHLQINNSLDRTGHMLGGLRVEMVRDRERIYRAMRNKFGLTDDEAHKAVYSIISRVYNNISNEATALTNHTKDEDFMISRALYTRYKQKK